MTTYTEVIARQAHTTDPRILNRSCYCPGDCNCWAPEWMHRTVFCGCRGSHE